MSDATGGATFKFTVEDREFLEALNRASNRLDVIPKSAAMWNAGFNIAQAAVSGFVATLNEWVTMAGEAELGLARMDAVLSATGFAAGKTTSQMAELASAIQRTTRFDDDAMMAGMAKLATFSAVTGETFERATRLSADLAEAGFGSVESAAVLLGKALQSPKEGMSALTRVGVTLTASQKDAIKYFTELNDTARSQAIILQAVQDQVGGVAESMGDTTAGKMVRMQHVLDDLKEAFGEVVARGITPFVDAMQGDFKSSSDGMIAKLNEMASAVEKLSQTWVNFGESVRKVPFIGSPLFAAGKALTTPGASLISKFFDQYVSSAKPGETSLNRASEEHFKKLSEDNRKWLADQQRATKVTLDETLDTAEAGTKAADIVDKHRAEMEKAADRIRESLKTSWDKAREKLFEIDDLADAGLLDKRTSRRAATAVGEDALKPYREAFSRSLDKIADFDMRIKEARESKDSGFTSSIESLTGMWSKIQTGAASTSDDVAAKRAEESLKELIKLREEAKKSSDAEKKVMEDVRDILRSSTGSGATFR